MLEKVIFALRIALGWLYFYAGITKIINPSWSAKGYILSANTMAGFYESLTQPGILSFVNFLNEWGLTLLGISLILGLFVRISSLCGVLLMILYYIPILNFPYVGEHSYLIDEHIIFSLVLIFFFVIRAGRTWGLDGKLIEKYPAFPRWLS